MRKQIVSILSTTAVAFLLSGEAHAACKSGLTNVYKDRYLTAKVVTSWCYSGGNVTHRHSVPSASPTNLGFAMGLRESTAEWTYSACHSFNGFRVHNCLAKRQFTFSNRYGPLAPKIGVCIATRIYGNGAHRRAISANC